MTTYNTDFTGHTDDVQPTNWTEQWVTASGTALARAGTAAENIGAKYLELDSNSVIYAASWDDVDGDANRDNVEVLARFTQDVFSTAVDIGFRVFIRGSGAAAAENAYVLSANETDELLFSKYVAGTSSSLGIFQLGTGYFVANDHYWFRLRANGTSIKAKVWKDGDNEPTAWTAEVTDSAVTGVGWVGAGSFDTDNIPELDFFSVGTNGDTAPDPAVDTGVEIRNTQQYTEVLGSVTDPEVRVTQHYIEVLGIRAAPATGGGNTQIVIAT